MKRTTDFFKKGPVTALTSGKILPRWMQEFANRKEDLRQKAPQLKKTGTGHSNNQNPRGAFHGSKYRGY